MPAAIGRGNFNVNGLQCPCGVCHGYAFLRCLAYGAPKYSIKDGNTIKYLFIHCPMEARGVKMLQIMAGINGRKFVNDFAHS